MERPYETHAVVEEGGRLTLSDLPFADGCQVAVQISSTPVAADAPRPNAEEWILSFEAFLEESGRRHPNVPPLSDEAMSRESIYEGRGE